MRIALRFNLPENTQRDSYFYKTSNNEPERVAEDEDEEEENENYSEIPEEMMENIKQQQQPPTNSNH